MVFSALFTLSDGSTEEILVTVQNEKAYFHSYKSDAVVNLNNAIVDLTTETATKLNAATNRNDYAKLLAQSLSNVIADVTLYLDNWTYDGGILVAEGSF